MLVARRDPPFHDGAHGSAPLATHAPAGHDAPPLIRIMTLLQIAGAALAIPVGLASGYSIYRANFSPETTCQTMRGNIVGTLGKNVDATTLRLLVRHDVETFEKSCGKVDPDATAAFRRLLTVDRTAKPIQSHPAAQVAKQTKPPSARPVSRPNIAAATQDLSSVHHAAATDAAEPEEPQSRATPTSDANWVAAVRQALVAHAPDSPETVPVVATQPAAPPPSATAARPIHSMSQANHEHAQVTTIEAPTSLATATVGAAPMTQRRVDHPVPPAPILGAAPSAELASSAHPESRGAPRSGGWVSHLPVVGLVLGAFASALH